MRAYVKARFNRPLEATDYMSAGGFEVVIRGEKLAFDFFDVAVEFHENIAEFWLKNLDTGYYPENHEKLIGHLHEITEVTDCHIYLGEDPGECEGLELEELLEFTLDDGNKSMHFEAEMLKNVEIF